MSVSGIEAGATITVSQIHILTSEFIDCTGKRVIARNSDLTAMSIINMRRSPNAKLVTTFIVGPDVTTAQLQRVRSRLQSYVREHSLEWRPTLGFSVGYNAPNCANVTVTLTHHAGWSESSRIGPGACVRGCKFETKESAHWARYVWCASEKMYIRTYININIYIYIYIYARVECCC